MPRPDRCASSTPRSPPRGRCAFFAYAWGALSDPLADTQIAAIARFAPGGFRTNPLTRLCGGRGDGAHYREIEAQRATLATTSTAWSTR
jgi:NAD-dependent DNA ligase